MNIKAKIGIAVIIILAVASAAFIFFQPEAESYEDCAPPALMVDGKLYLVSLEKVADPPEESQIAGRLTNYIPQTRAPETNDTSNTICCVNQPYAFVDGDLIVYAVNVHLSGALPEHTVDAWFYCEPYK